MLMTAPDASDTRDRARVDAQASRRSPRSATCALSDPGALGVIRTDIGLERDVLRAGGAAGGASRWSRNRAR